MTRNLGNKKRHVVVVVTSRANYARVKSAMIAIHNHPSLDLQVIVGASAVEDRYGSVVRFIQSDALKIVGQIKLDLNRKDLVAMAKATGDAIMKFATTLKRCHPDVVLAVADRYETIAVTVASAYLNVPIAHLLGGELSGSIDEKVRHAATKLSDIHFVANEKARSRLIQMGENESVVHLTGCPSMDLALRVSEDGGLEIHPFSATTSPGVPFDLKQPYLIVLQHPVTTEYQEAAFQTKETLAAISELKLQTLWFWPNVDPGSTEILQTLMAFRKRRKLRFVRFVKNMPPENFLKLVNRSACVVGNSSVGIRECSFLGVPAVNIGTRQAGRDRGRNVIDIRHDRSEIANAIRRQLEIGRYLPESLYGDGHAGERIANLLATVEISIEKRLHI
jgi:UDP-hydrolysing UDP-N-acetyl-D-glucosamine 2-epimerase